MIENLVTHPKTDLLPYGTIQTFEMEMKPYPDHRRRMIRVWLPDDYDGVKRFPVVYMHDGQGLFRSDDGRAKLEPDRAITKLKEEIGFSAIVVGIDNSPMRGTELTPPYTRRTRQDPVGGHPVPVIPGESTTATYAKFVVEHLKPLIDENYMTLPDAVNTCVGGISAGGSASYYMFLQYPEVFGKAIVCSPGFPIFPEEVLMEELDNYDYARLADHRIAFYNGDQGLDATSTYMVLDVYRKLRDKGLDTTRNMVLIDSRQTHYESAWRTYLPELLRFLFAENNLAEYPPKN